MKKKLLMILTVAVLCVIISGKYASEMKSVTVFSMDTIMTVKTAGSRQNLKYAENEIERLDKIFNAYDSASELYKINASGGGKMSEDMQKAVGKATEYSENTEGSFDITLKTLKDLWNITAENPKIPENDEILNALEKCGIENVEISNDEITLKNDVQLDLGGIAKGYAADVLAEGLKSRNVKKFILDLGGNIYAYSENKPLKIGIQNPYKARGDTLCVLELKDGAVVSSGTYERNFEYKGKVYHHILDPKTGYPAESGISQVTIVGKNAALCDAYSTAMLVMGVEEAKKLYRNSGEFEYIIVSENKIFISGNLKDSVTEIAEGFELIIS